MDIVSQIMNHLRRDPSRKQHLMMGCNLAHNVVTRYLARLVKGGHVLELPLSSGKGHFYTISPSGNELIIKLNEAQEAIEELLSGE